METIEEIKEREKKEEQEYFKKINLRTKIIFMEASEKPKEEKPELQEGSC